MKLVSLNIEGAKHWNLVDPFLAAQQADVICLQEVYEEDAIQHAKALKMQLAFAPMVFYPDVTTHSNRLLGVAMFSHSPLNDIAIQNYHMPDKEIQNFDETNEHTVNKTIRRALLSANITNDGKTFTVATTHFTWIPDGLARDYQYAAAEKLLTALEKFPEVMVCGDFNTPRGVNGVYERFAEKYHDVIPASHASSLDLTIHRGRKDPAIAARLAGYMVDYLFLSKGYQAHDVRLESGVSDHCAIVATVDIAP
jgi:endonuclease/exonuclease/phosphatase family metal-dependent hydrolase